MIISHDHKFIFFSAGKTGTTSIEHCLAEYDQTPPISKEDNEKFSKHIPPAIFRSRVTAEVWQTYYKFAFVRNPWDWVVSAHFFTGKKSKRVRKLSAEDITYLANTIPLRGITWDTHRTQLAFLSDPEGKLCVDFVGKFERLQQDFDTVCQHLKVPLRKLPILNTTDHLHYSAYYTEESQKRVAELYRRDIEAFGYEFESVVQPTASLGMHPLAQLIRKVAASLGM